MSPPSCAAYFSRFAHQTLISTLEQQKHNYCTVQTNGNSGRCLSSNSAGASTEEINKFCAPARLPDRDSNFPRNKKNPAPPSCPAIPMHDGRKLLCANQCQRDVVTLPIYERQTAHTAPAAATPGDHAHGVSMSRVKVGVSERIKKDKTEVDAKLRQHFASPDRHHISSAQRNEYCQQGQLEHTIPTCWPSLASACKLSTCKLAAHCQRHGSNSLYHNHHRIVTY